MKDKKKQRKNFYIAKPNIMRKGSIIRGVSQDNTFHPIVYLERRDEDSFTGCILTHDPTREENIPMLEEHFEINDENGNRYQIQYENTCMVNIRFIKMNDWINSNVVGQLTRAGIQFVEDNLTENAEVFDGRISEYREAH